MNITKDFELNKYTSRVIWDIAENNHDARVTQISMQRAFINSSSRLDGFDRLSFGMNYLWMGLRGHNIFELNSMNVTSFVPPDEFAESTAFTRLLELFMTFMEDDMRDELGRNTAEALDRRTVLALDSSLCFNLDIPLSGALDEYLHP